MGAEGGVAMLAQILIPRTWLHVDQMLWPRGAVASERE